MDMHVFRGNSRFVQHIEGAVEHPFGVDSVPFRHNNAHSKVGTVGQVFVMA